MSFRDIDEIPAVLDPHPLKNFLLASREERLDTLSNGDWFDAVIYFVNGEIVLMQLPEVKKMDSIIDEQLIGYVGKVDENQILRMNANKVTSSFKVWTILDDHGKPALDYIQGGKSLVEYIEEVELYNKNIDLSKEEEAEKVICPPRPFKSSAWQEELDVTITYLPMILPLQCGVLPLRP